MINYQYMQHWRVSKKYLFLSVVNGYKYITFLIYAALKPLTIYQTE